MLTGEERAAVCASGRYIAERTDRPFFRRLTRMVETSHTLHRTEALNIGRKRRVLSNSTSPKRGGS